MTRLNVVPQDYVLDALTWLSLNAREPGKVFQLADPEPLTVDELVRHIGKACRRWVLRLPVPAGPTRAALKYLPIAQKITGFTPAMVDYFVHPTYYLTDNVDAALAPSGIRCPSFRDILPRLVEYVKRHPEAVG